MGRGVSLSEMPEVGILAVDAGVRPCYQIAAVVDGLLCGLVGKIVARLGDNCKRLLGDEFDRTEVGYAFRDAFECASWLKYGCRQEWLLRHSA